MRVKNGWGWGSFYSLTEEVPVRNGELCWTHLSVHTKGLSEESSEGSMNSSREVLGQQPHFSFYWGSSHHRKRQNIFFMQLLVSIFLSRKKWRMKWNKPSHQMAEGTRGLSICKTRLSLQKTNKQKVCFVSKISRYLVAPYFPALWNRKLLLIFCLLQKLF